MGDKLIEEISKIGNAIWTVIGTVAIAAIWLGAVFGWLAESLF